MVKGKDQAEADNAGCVYRPPNNVMHISELAMPNPVIVYGIMSWLGREIPGIGFVQCSLWAPPGYYEMGS